MRVYLLFIFVYLFVEHFNFPSFQMVAVCPTFCGRLPKVCNVQCFHAVDVPVSGLLGYSAV